MGLLDGKRGLIVGIANDRSYAYFIAESLIREGAECLFTHLPGDKMQRRVGKAIEELGVDDPCRCGHCGGPLTGKVGMAYKGKRYRNYWCSRSLRSKAFCGVANGHSSPKLESAVSHRRDQQGLLHPGGVPGGGVLPLRVRFRPNRTGLRAHPRKSLVRYPDGNDGRPPAALPADPGGSFPPRPIPS